jgi:hypothetical protein
MVSIRFDAQLFKVLSDMGWPSLSGYRIVGRGGLMKVLMTLKDLSCQ